MDERWFAKGWQERLLGSLLRRRPRTGGQVWLALGLLCLTMLLGSGRWSVDILSEARAASALSASEWMERATRMRATPPVDWLAVRQAYEQAAALGSLPAMSHVGWIYEQGLTGAPDLATAAKWYEPVAESGQDEFAIKLGWLYLQADLGPDRARSEHWFQTAIQRDSAAARVALASVLVADAQGGLHVERIHEAHALLETAMAQGHPLASRFLARIHVEQIGDYPSTEASRLYYTRVAAEDGQAMMQAWLAQRYLDGDGVPRDPMEAAFWAALAAAGGDPLGLQLHQRLQAQLVDEQQLAVLERTLAWALR